MSIRERRIRKVWSLRCSCVQRVVKITKVTIRSVRKIMMVMTFTRILRDYYGYDGLLRFGGDSRVMRGVSGLLRKLGL